MEWTGTQVERTALCFTPIRVTRHSEAACASSTLSSNMVAITLDYHGGDWRDVMYSAFYTLTRTMRGTTLKEPSGSSRHPQFITPSG